MNSLIIAQSITQPNIHSIVNEAIHTEMTKLVNNGFVETIHGLWLPGVHSMGRDDNIMKGVKFIR